MQNSSYENEEEEPDMEMFRSIFNFEPLHLTNIHSFAFQGDSSEDKNFDEIMEWFERNNIRKGNPEDIVSNYEKHQK